ncbi:hypothetical protein LINPERPRIM_LOCUS41008 [Linum perenne]
MKNLSGIFCLGLRIRGQLSTPHRLNALHEDTMYLRDPVWSAIHHPRLYLEGNLRLVLVVTNVIGNIQRVKNPGSLG